MIGPWAYDLVGTPEEVTLDPAEVLRDQERLLATEYGASRPPYPLGGEDLECDDPSDARHWVGVYTELTEFVHALIEEQSSARPGDPNVESRLPDSARAIALQARLLDLHLAYWTDRLRRLSGDSPSPGGEEGGER